jgi:hypothetical protein
MPFHSVMPRDQLDDSDQAPDQADRFDLPSPQRQQALLAAEFARARWARAAAKTWSDSATVPAPR